jgi:hypothetical protein
VFKNKMLMKIIIVVVSVSVLALLINVGCTAVRAGYESAPYKVIRGDGPFEVRDYPALVLVETVGNGSDGSFMRLFHYISGQNSAQEKIAMTTPVFMTGSSTNAKMSFVMPAHAEANKMPRPNETGVVVKSMSAGTFAVLRFSGGRSFKNETNAVCRLQTWLTQEKITSTNSPVFGYFDPPWTPTFFRRNEVMLRLNPN